MPNAISRGPIHSAFSEACRHIMPTFADKDLLAVFKHPSPLSRRTIRARLGYPPNAVVSRVLFDATQNGLLRRVKPHEVGSLKHTVHTYAVI